MKKENIKKFVEKLQKEKERFLVKIEDINHPEEIKNWLSLREK